jgi:hypothetical protein
VREVEGWLCLFFGAVPKPTWMVSALSCASHPESGEKEVAIVPAGW